MSWGQWWYVIKGVGYVRTRRGLVIPGSSRFVNEVKVEEEPARTVGPRYPGVMLTYGCLDCFNNIQIFRQRNLVSMASISYPSGPGVHCSLASLTEGITDIPRLPH